MLYSTCLNNLKLFRSFTKDKQIFYIGRKQQNEVGIQKINDLVPPAYLSMNFEKDLITFEEFEFSYKGFMEDSYVKDALRKLHKMSKDKDVIIVGDYDNYKNCHRLIIGEFISSFNQVKYKEITKEDVGDIDLRSLIEKPCIVKLSTNGIYMLVDDSLIGINSAMNLNNFGFDKDLISRNKKYSIDVIYKICTKSIKNIFSLSGLEKIWEREVFHEAI